MPGYFFAAAELVAFVAFPAHSIVGGKYPVRPLLATTKLPRIALAQLFVLAHGPWTAHGHGRYTCMCGH
jgi:hypothetical protein